MKLTRRNTVIGIGTLAAGAGVIGGTGAFDQVQATRDFDVGVTDDDQAILTLDDHDDSSITGTESAGGANNQDILTISMSEQLNDEAVTTFLTAFTVGNNGTNEVELSVTFQDSSGNEVSDPGVAFQADNTDSTLPSGVNDGDSLDGTAIPSGSSVDVKIVVDTRANPSSSSAVNGGNYDQDAIDSVLFDAQSV